MDINNILTERKATHGSFEVNAMASQTLKTTVEIYCCKKLTDVQKEALDNICQKIARIITGNPNEIDHWRDISGYSTLAAKEIEAKVETEILNLTESE